MDFSTILSEATQISANTENKNKVRFLTKEEIAKLAPVAYAAEPTNPNLSKHYTFASTEKVINDMKTLGWEVTEARQPRKRNRSALYSYHMIIFHNTNPEYKILHTNKNGEDDSYYPEIILTNSHDGFTSFSFRIAIYQSSSDKRIVITTDDFTNIYIRHIGYSFEELQKLINTVMEQLPVQVAVMNKMQGRILTDDEKRALALSALRNRKNDQELQVPNFILDEILEPSEDEVEPINLWETFSIINRKMIDGEFTMVNKNGKLRKARKIKSIWKYIHYSQSIFATAYKMI